MKATKTFQPLTLICILAMLAPMLTMSASAQDRGNGIDGNPTECTNNWQVGRSEPVKATDGRIVGYSQMWWSESCQANWVRAYTVSGDDAVMESSIWQGRPPGPDREFVFAFDYANDHFTMYLHAGRGQKMCGSTSIWDVRKENWAFTGSYCRT